MSNSQAIEVTEANFFETINRGVSLIDFWAPWCGPCRTQGPIVEKVAQQFGGQANVGKMNIDSSPSVASQFGVRSIPTLSLFQNGHELERFVGIQTEDRLVGAIDAILAKQVTDTFVRV